MRYRFSLFALIILLALSACMVGGCGGGGSSDVSTGNAYAGNWSGVYTDMDINGPNQTLEYHSVLTLHISDVGKCTGTLVSTNTTMQDVVTFTVTSGTIDSQTGKVALSLKSDDSQPEIDVLDLVVTKTSGGLIASGLVIRDGKQYVATATLLKK